MRSKTLLVNYLGTMFLEIWLCYPHCLECSQGTQYWTTNPRQKLSLRRTNNTKFSSCGKQNLKIFAYSLSGSWEHCVSSTENNIGVEIFSDIQIAFHDWLENHLLKSWHFKIKFWGIEKGLCTFKSLISKCYDLSIRKSVSTVVSICLLVIFIKIVLPLSSAS